jgi:hypothetical protein
VRRQEVDDAEALGAAEVRRRDDVGDVQRRGRGDRVACGCHGPREPCSGHGSGRGAPLVSAGRWWEKPSVGGGRSRRTGWASVQREECDVCIVGAGYAGLTAARRLTQAGLSVVVLGARDRVGGRIWTETRPSGTAVDRGGVWLGARHDAIRASRPRRVLEGIARMSSLWPKGAVSPMPGPGAAWRGG